MSNSSTIFFLSFLLLSITSIKSNGITQHGDVRTTGDFITKELIITEPIDMEIRKMKLGAIETKEINTAQINGNVLVTDEISAKNADGTIYVNSLLKINGEVTYNNVNNNQESSFVELSNIYIDGVKQWQNIHFYSEEKSFDEVNDLLNSKVCDEKTFEVELDVHLVNENPADHYKVEMLYEFVNKYWNKNSAYIKVGDEFYWADNHNWGELTKEDENDETFWQSPVSFIIPGRFVKDELIKLTFGFKINKKNASFCKESGLKAFKFSHLSVYVK